MNHRKHSPIHALCMLMIAALLAMPAGMGTEATDRDDSVIQDDAESGGDAPDACVNDAPSSLNLIVDGTYGELVPVDDPSDVYTITVKIGETIDVVQDLASSDDTSLQLNLPHTPHLPHVAEGLHDDTQNPFAMDILDRYCNLVESSSDPAVLPRTITLDTAGTYQVLVYESGATTTTVHKDEGAGMCHPPCRLGGYLIDHVAQ